MTSPSSRLMHCGRPHEWQSGDGLPLHTLSQVRRLDCLNKRYNFGFASRRGDPARNRRCVVLINWNNNVSLELVLEYFEI
jgi:hypothetical protein